MEQATNPPLKQGQKIVYSCLKKLYGESVLTPNNRQVEQISNLVNGFAFACNLGLFIGKLLFALFTGSIALMVDAFNNLSDFVSTIMAVIGMKLAKRPPDKEHPHGHAIIEQITALFIAFLVLLVGLAFLKSSFTRLLHPEPVIFEPLTLIVLICSIVLKLGMFWFYKYCGILIHSQTFKATAIDALSDVYTTSTILLAYCLLPFTTLPLDAAVAFCLAILIIKNTLGVLKETISLLIGQKMDLEVEKRLLELLYSVPEVKNCHDLRYHEYGNCKIAAIDLEVPGQLSIATIHAKIDAIEQQIAKELGIKLYTHFEPQASKEDFDLDEKRLLCAINSCLRSFNAASRLHDLKIDPKKKRLRFDIEYPVPAADTFKEEQLQQQFLQLFQSELAKHHFKRPYATYEMAIGLFASFN